MLDYPKTHYVQENWITNVCADPWGTGGCTFCTKESGECPCNCGATNEYYDDVAGACAACNGLCATCWGSSNEECFSCNPGYTFTYHGNSCDGFCGDGVVTGDE